MFGVQTPIYGEKLLIFGSRQMFLKSLQAALGDKKLDRDILFLLFLGNDALRTVARNTAVLEVPQFRHSKKGLHIIENPPYLLTFRALEATGQENEITSYTFELIEKGIVFDAALFTVTVRFNTCKLFS